MQLVGERGDGQLVGQGTDTPQGRGGSDLLRQTLERSGVRLSGAEGFGEDIGAADQVHACPTVEQASLDA